MHKKQGEYLGIILLKNLLTKKIFQCYNKGVVKRLTKLKIERGKI